MLGRYPQAVAPNAASAHNIALTYSLENESDPMQSNNKVLDDLAKVANGAVSTLVGMKGEAEALVRQQLERLLTEMNVAQRDEFEVVKAMAQKARMEQEKLEKRVVKLETQLKKAKAGVMVNCSSLPKPKPITLVELES